MRPLKHNDITDGPERGETRLVNHVLLHLHLRHAERKGKSADARSQHRAVEEVAQCEMKQPLARMQGYRFTIPPFSRWGSSF